MCDETSFESTTRHFARIFYYLKQFRVNSVYIKEFLSFLLPINANPLALVPLTNFLYALWSSFIGIVLWILGMHEPYWQFLLYTTGRYVTALFGALSVMPVYTIFNKYFRQGNSPGWISYFPSLLFAFMPGSVFISHWITYNSLIVFIELICLQKILYIVNNTDAILQRKRFFTDYNFILLGCFFGLGLTAKWTVVPLMGAYVLFFSWQCIQTIFKKKPAEWKLLWVLLTPSICSVVFYAAITVWFFPFNDPIHLNYYRYSFIGGNVLSSAAGTFNLYQYLNRFTNFFPGFFSTWPLGTGLITTGLGLAGVVLILLRKTQRYRSVALLILWFFCFSYTMGPNYIGKAAMRNQTIYILMIFFSSILLDFFIQKRIQNQLIRKFFYVAAGSALFQSVFIVVAINYFFLNDDIRASASDWIYENIKPESIIYEPYGYGPYWWSPDIIFSDSRMPPGQQRYIHLNSERLRSQTLTKSEKEQNWYIRNQWMQDDSIIREIPFIGYDPSLIYTDYFLLTQRGAGDACPEDEVFEGYKKYMRQKGFSLCAEFIFLPDAPPIIRYVLQNRIAHLFGVKKILIFRKAQ